MDTSNIERCRVVFSDENGFTVASSNLREGVGELGEQSIYAVHAALGLSVSDIIFQGCQTVIVEGPSDQFYFNAIKNHLISKKLIAPKQDIVFIPSGGVRGVPGVVSLLTGKNKKLPFVILDSDKSGLDSKNKLKSGLYKDSETCLLDIKEYVGFDNSEVEDLIPYCLLNKGLNHLFLSVEEESFDDVYDENKPILPQIEEFARNNTVDLESSKGWKVELAKSAKKELSKKHPPEIKERYKSMWVKLFEKIIENE